MSKTKFSGPATANSSLPQRLQDARSFTLQVDDLRSGGDVAERAKARALEQHEVREPGCAAEQQDGVWPVSQAGHDGPDPAEDQHRESHPYGEVDDVDEKPLGDAKVVLPAVVDARRTSLFHSRIPLWLQSTMNSFAPVVVRDRWAAALSATW